eukprot:5688729-Pyramimonas_sp.AAC.2
MLRYGTSSKMMLYGTDCTQGRTFVFWRLFEDHFDDLFVAFVRRPVKHYVIVLAKYRTTTTRSVHSSSRTLLGRNKKPLPLTVIL